MCYKYNSGYLIVEIHKENYIYVASKNCLYAVFKIYTLYSRNISYNYVAIAVPTSYKTARTHVRTKNSLNCIIYLPTRMPAAAAAQPILFGGGLTTVVAPTINNKMTTITKSRISFI